jgi:Mn2+/Fe2+ NRAMP family transporter
MGITKLKKYISWNIISVIGYICIVITFIFLMMLMVASSGTTIRPDINMYFYDYIVKHLLIPYIGFYKFQLFLIALCMILSVIEQKYYEKTSQYGLELFENHSKGYSLVFTIGICLNFVPLNIFFVIVMLWLMRFI